MGEGLKRAFVATRKTRGLVWHPMDLAPQDGTRFMARRVDVELETWYGKASHVPWLGWCHGKVEDVDLWEPTTWRQK